METARATRTMAIFLGAIVAAVPLVVDPWGFAPFGPIKWATLTLLAAGIVVVLSLNGRLVAPRRWAVGWLVFLAWGAIASLRAVDPVYTWVGTPDRHLGLLAWALFAVMFFAAATLSDDVVPLLLKAAVLALAGIGGYVVLELFGLAPVELAGSSGRPGGPFGTPAYLGAACALLVPIGIGAAVDGLGSTVWRRVAIVTSTVGVLAAAASQTRAGWFGLAVAVVIAWPAIAPWVRVRRGLVAGFVAVGVVVVAVTPLAGRITSALDFESGGARGRIDEWEVGIAVLAGHPVTGLGFEGYRIGFAEGVDAEYERRYGRTFTPDRAHSGALDVGVTTGIPGMVVYLLGAGALVVAATRGVRRGVPWLAGVAAGVAAYVAQQQFLFPTVEGDAAFWVFAGVLVAATTRSAVTHRVPRGTWLVGLVLVGAVGVAGALDLVADHAVANALDLEREGRRIEANQRASDAVALRPDSIRYGFIAASIAGRDGTTLGSARAVQLIDDAIVVSPRDPILLAARAGYRLDLAVVERERSILDLAIGEWEALVARDPNHAQFQLELGIAYAVAGRGDDAADVWLFAADLAPSSGAPWANLASLAVDRMDPEAAERALAELELREPDSDLIDPLRDRIAVLQRDNG